MSSNPKLKKNGGKGTFFGNLLRGIVKTGKSVGEPLINAISGGSASKIANAISGDQSLSQSDKEMLLSELQQDVIEMQEITKRWESDMKSDSWLSKNIRPLSLAFLTVALFIYIILDSSLNGFSVANQWITLLSSLLMLVYGGYFGARALEKVTKMRSDVKDSKTHQRVFDKIDFIKDKLTLSTSISEKEKEDLLLQLRYLTRLLE